MIESEGAGVGQHGVEAYRAAYRRIAEAKSRASVSCQPTSSDG